VPIAILSSLVGGGPHGFFPEMILSAMSLAPHPWIIEQNTPRTPKAISTLEVVLTFLEAFSTLSSASLIKF
jgi:hypothetical protein